MHDAVGRELKVGDKVVMLGEVTQLSPTEDYCNVSVKSDLGRRPDGLAENISAINTGVLLRNNPGDQTYDLADDGQLQPENPDAVSAELPSR